MPTLMVGASRSKDGKQKGEGMGINGNVPMLINYAQRARELWTAAAKPGTSAADQVGLLTASQAASSIATVGLLEQISIHLAELVDRDNDK